MMIDFSNGAIDLKKTTFEEIKRSFSKEFPSPAKVILKDGKHPQIKIKNGLWRSVTLHFANDNDKTQLTGYRFTMPNFFSVILLYIASLAMLSVVFTVAVSGSLEEFTPMFIVGGGTAFAFTSIFHSLIVKKVMKSWMPRLESALDTLKA